MIKFMKYCVKNTENGAKARVHYSYADDIIVRGGAIKKCEHITIYAKDYSDDFENVFGDKAENDSDSMTDYFERSHVRIYKDDPLYADALAIC